MFLPIEYLQHLKTQSFSSLKVLAPFFFCLFTVGQFASTTQLKKKHKQTKQLLF